MVRPFERLLENLALGVAGVGDGRKASEDCDDGMEGWWDRLTDAGAEGEGEDVLRRRHDGCGWLVVGLGWRGEGWWRRGGSEDWICGLCR